MKRPGLLALLVTLLLGVLALGLLFQTLTKWKDKTPSSSNRSAGATYAGANACKECHAKQYQDWLGSDHQLAMQVATPETVLGDFKDAHFTYFGVTSHFFTRDGKFFVNTDGPDGKLQDYEIKYTFGVHPLQQYLIPFPDGRLQALSLSWDSRPKKAGGQRWFHLHPKENIRAGDELHWTGYQQNWNFMCAECHSTDLKKNYDEATNTYKTTWSEINVSCEACHGAASEHVKWAKQHSQSQSNAPVANDGLLAHFDDRRDAYWKLNYITGNSQRSRPRANTDELEMCGRCHARRSEISENWAPGKSLLNTHRAALLDAGLFTADGQMQDEVYNYASFLQSKMFHEGVTCSDCHEPHTQKLRAPKAEVCGNCHYLKKYASAEHHHHKEGAPEASCIACHMSARTYMVVDTRHDHSFRIPRPDESVKYGTPNACNDCHKDKTAAWAAKATDGWYGTAHKGFQQYTPTLTAGRRQSATAAPELVELAKNPDAPNIARATALSELAPYFDADASRVTQAALESNDPLLRLAAVELVASSDAGTRWRMLSPLLNDPVLAVRAAAANGVVDAVPKNPAPEDQARFDGALADYVATQKLNSDRPEAHLSLGDLYAREGQAGQAEAAYKLAITRWPQFVPAYVNLADLFRAEGHDDEAEHWLVEAQKRAPQNAEVTHALALLRVRQHRTSEALPLLQKAMQLAPDNAHYAYVYGVGLYSSGKAPAGLEVLRKANEQFPANREILLGLISLSADSGDLASARKFVDQFERIAPADGRGREILAKNPSSQPGNASDVR